MTDAERADKLYELARAWLNWIEAYICADLPMCEDMLADLAPSTAHSGALDDGACT